MVGDFNSIRSSEERKSVGNDADYRRDRMILLILLKN